MDASEVFLYYRASGKVHQLTSDCRNYQRATRGEVAQILWNIANTPGVTG